MAKTLNANGGRNRMKSRFFAPKHKKDADETVLNHNQMSFFLQVL